MEINSSLNDLSRSLTIFLIRSLEPSPKLFLEPNFLIKVAFIKVFELLIYITYLIIKKRVACSYDLILLDDHEEILGE